MIMQTFKTLDDAIELARYAHRNQIDKAGLKYIEHPLRVLAKVQAQGAMPFVQVAAVLHDVSEDTAFTTDILLDLGFSEAAVSLICLLDRGYSKNMFSMLMGGTPDSEAATDYYYAQINANPNARLIKLADIEDNLSPWRLSYLEPATQERLKAKYAKALTALGA
jgi:(p)ppGpp synthase/HD superfamily hydrolase